MKKKIKDITWEAAAAKVLEEYHRELGKRGGEERAKNLSKEELAEIGRKGAQKRWAKKSKKGGRHE